MMTEDIFTSIKRKRENERFECRICGSSALYSYFGVISCEACKVFFKRNAHFGENRLKCPHDGQCEINMDSRHTCASCRLSKCFKKGMKSEMIRRSIVNRKKNLISNTLVKANYFGKLPTMNLLEKDNSLLDSSQWILLTNLIHNYQESKLFFISERIKHEIDSIKLINQSTLQNLLRSFYTTTGNSLRSNIDIAHSPCEDRSILLHTAATNVTCIGGQFIFYHSQLINYELFWNYLERIYGKITTDYNRWSSSFAEPDIIIFKLSIALFTFSTNARIFYRNIEGEYTNNNQILNIQNKYAELTWKYLLYRYSYREAIRRFVNIIQWFLALTVFMQYVHDVDVHVNDIESLVEQTEARRGVRKPLRFGFCHRAKYDIRYGSFADFVTGGFLAFRDKIYSGKELMIGIVLAELQAAALGRIGFVAFSTVIE